MKIKKTHHWKRLSVAEQYKKSYHIIGISSICVFFCVGICGVISIFIGKDNFADIQKTFRNDASLFEMSDMLFSENIPSRDAMIAGLTTCITATGGNRVGDVYITEDRLLEFPKELQHDDLLATADSINDFYEKYQIPTYVIAVPPAGEFYASDLLEGLSYPTQLTEISLYYDNLSPQIRTIDVYHVLFTTTSAYIYNRTDPRWTCYGAYCVYRNAIQKMGFVPISYDQYAITHAGTFRGSLYQESMYQNIADDILDIYICETGCKLTEMLAYDEDGNVHERSMFSKEQDLSQDPYDFYLGKACEKMILRTNLNTKKKLLILKDSYADCMVPFLLQHYSEICLLDLTCTQKNINEYVDVSLYDQVLFLCDADTYAQSDLLTSFLKEVN